MCFWFYSNSLDRTLFYSNMTVSLCIRQGSKRNDDSVSVEELDWSAESQVLIPAEHLWCDFKLRLWAKNSSQTPMTCTYGYSHFIHFKTVATEAEIQFFYNLVLDGNKYMNCFHLCFHSLKVFFSLLKKSVSQYFCPYNDVQVIGVWWWVFDLVCNFVLWPRTHCS